MICFLVVSLVQATTVLAETALLQSTASEPRQQQWPCLEDHETQ